MDLFTRMLLPALAAASSVPPLLAQLPFYTDDLRVTEPGNPHLEFFNEFDALQSSQYPNLRQNASNFRLNCGLSHRLELDVDAPFVLLFPALAIPNSPRPGDTDLGVKWSFRRPSKGSRLPSLAASLYIEFPTGNERQQLGSGLTDYWLNFITRVPLTDKTRTTTNFGFLFAGNTSAGVVGVQTRRGQVSTGGISLLYDFSPRLTLGSEAHERRRGHSRARPERAAGPGERHVRSGERIRRYLCCAGRQI